MSKIAGSVRSWCAVRREDHPSVRVAAVASVRLACEPLPRGAAAVVDVQGTDGGRRMKARAAVDRGEV